MTELLEIMFVTSVEVGERAGQAPVGLDVVGVLDGTRLGFTLGLAEVGEVVGMRLGFRLGDRLGVDEGIADGF